MSYTSTNEKFIEALSKWIDCNTNKDDVVLETFAGDGVLTDKLRKASKDVVFLSSDFMEIRNFDVISTRINEEKADARINYKMKAHCAIKQLVEEGYEISNLKYMIMGWPAHTNDGAYLAAKALYYLNDNNTKIIFIGTENYIDEDEKKIATPNFYKHFKIIDDLEFADAVVVNYDSETGIDKPILGEFILCNDRNCDCSDKILDIYDDFFDDCPDCTPDLSNEVEDNEYE